jgi:hypothetical protein
MKKQILPLFIFLLLLANTAIYGQSQKSRIQPGKMYNQGDTLYSPLFGFSTSVPTGWMGNLPRESEVFLLMNTSSKFGEIFVFGRESINLDSLAQIWASGVDITGNIRLTAANPKLEGDLLTSNEVIAEGNYLDKGYKAFAATRCGDKGKCITVLAIADEGNFESVSNTAVALLKNGVFEEPSNISPYDNFDWKKFLSNKLVITYDETQGGAKRTQINLCEDGTFRANVRKQGILKQVNPQYKGNMSGTWTADGIGPETLLTLTFSGKKLPPLSVKLHFKDEQLYAENERYYASESTSCNK